MQEFAELLPPWLPPALVVRASVALGGAAVIWLLAGLVRRSLGRWVRDGRTRYRARKAVNVVALVVGFLFVASVLLDRLTGLGVALGVSGAAVAFALQEPLLSMAGWAALAFGGYYRTGDRVELGGVTGDVIDVSLLRTTIFEVGGAAKTGPGYSGRVVRVSNAAVFREPVYNFSGDFPFLWDAVEVPIRHGSDRAQARELLEEAVRETVGDYVPEASATWRRLQRKYLLAESSVEPGVRVSADENWLTYTVRFVSDYRRRLEVKDELWRRILDAVDAADDVAIATASQEVTVTPGSEVTVRRGADGPAREDADGREGNGAV